VCELCHNYLCPTTVGWIWLFRTFRC
jgi:hypothetical protein